MLKRTLLLLLLIATPASADEIWACTQRRAVPVYTDAPTESIETICTPHALDKAAFNRIPSNAFDRLTQARIASLRNKVFEKKAAPVKPAPSQVEPRISWRYRQVRENPRSVFTTGCHISGFASSPRSGQVKIQVLRGALTAHELTLRLPMNSRPVPWEIELKGPCRSPKLSVSVLDK